LSYVTELALELATEAKNHFLRYSVCTIKIFPKTGLKPFGLTVGLGVGTPL